MLDCRRHHGAPELESIGAASRMVLDELELRIRAKSAPTPWPKTFPKRPGEAEAKPGTVRRARREAAPRFVMAVTNGRGGRVRE